MKVHEYIPQKNPRKAIGLISILISAAVGFFLFPTVFKGMPMSWLFQATAVGCLVGAIFIYSRYLVKTEVYRLERDEDSGEIDFTVTEITNKGKSSITVCRFALSGIEEADIFYFESKDDEKRKKELIKRAKKENRKIFDYCPQMMSEVVCGLLVEECGEKLLIKVTPDKVLLDAFRDAAQKNIDSKDKT